MNELKNLQKLTTICITKTNYNTLKSFAFAGESLNDALSRVLEQVKVENK